MESFKFELGEDKSYNYLIKMPMDSVSKENVEKLMKEKTIKEKELAALNSMKIEDMWLNELTAFKKEYLEFIDFGKKDWQHAFIACFPGTPLDESKYANMVTKHLDVNATHIDIEPLKN